MQTKKFWDFFNNQAAPLLARREHTFRKIFEYLDTFSGPIIIVETGCARLKGNWAGDGQSTVLFDQYINARDENSVCVTVDISEISVRECRSLVSKRTQIFNQDSVRFISKLVKKLTADNKTIDFLYLDSYDLDWNNWQPSAIHHLKELAIAVKALRSDSLVVVDDCTLTADFIPEENNKIDFFTNPRVGGKGRLVAEFADAVGGKCVFAKYQAGWINLV